MILCNALQLARLTHVFDRYAHILTRNAPYPMRLSRRCIGHPIVITLGKPAFASVRVNSFGGQILDIRWRELHDQRIWPASKTDVSAWLLERLKIEIPNSIHEQSKLLRGL